MKFNVLAATMYGLGFLAPMGASAQSTGLDGIARPSTNGLNTMQSYVLSARENSDLLDGDTATRIYGGRAAEQGAWPAQVSLHSTDKLDGTEGQI